MEILKVDEHEDGSATLQIDFSAKEIGYLVEKAMVDMLEAYIKTTPSYVHNET